MITRVWVVIAVATMPALGWAGTDAGDAEHMLGSIERSAHFAWLHPGEALPEAKAAARTASKLSAATRRNRDAHAAAKSLERAVDELADVTQQGNRQAEVRARAVDVSAGARVVRDTLRGPPLPDGERP